MLLGACVLAGGYVAFPEFFAWLLRPADAKHVDVNTANVAAIHIATSDPNISLMVFEHEGRVSVTFNRLTPNGDYEALSASADKTDPNITLDFTRKEHGIVTVLKNSDTDGIPTKKITGRSDQLQIFERKPIDWLRIQAKKP